MALMSATKMPRITRKMKMPALSASDGTRPVIMAFSSVPPSGMNEPLMMASTVPMGSNPVSRSAPTNMPMKKRAVGFLRDEREHDSHDGRHERPEGVDELHLSSL